MFASFEEWPPYSPGLVELALWQLGRLKGRLLP
jgi:hypothetical protein